MEGRHERDGGGARHEWSRDEVTPPSGFGFRVSGFRLRVSGFGFRVSGFGFRVSGLGFQLSAFGFRLSVANAMIGLALK